MADYAYKSSSELFELIKRVALENYPDSEWIGLQEGRLETLLAKIVAEISALNSRYIDLRALNAYLETVITRRDARNIAGNLGLVTRERNGATCDLTVTATDDVTVPKGSKFSSTNGTSFVSTADLVLSTGTSLTGTVQIVHADYSQLVFRAIGEANENISLNKDDVLIGQLIVTVDSVAYTQVDNWSASLSTDTHFVVTFDDRNRAVLVFGNGVYGTRLGADAEIIVDVFTGGGIEGNAVDEGSITSLSSTFTDSDNVDTVTNASAPTGGRAADSLDVISKLVPAQMSSVAGFVNRVDGANAIVSQLSWCQDATIDSTFFTTISGMYLPTNEVCVLTTASGVMDIDSNKQSELSVLLADRGELGCQWNIANPIDAPIEIDANVTISNKNLSNEKIASIKSALSTDGIYSLENLEFGSEHTNLEVLQAIQDVPGVVYAQLNKYARIPQILTYTGVNDGIFGDLELGSNSENGFFSFEVSAADAADVYFNRPVYIEKLGSNFVGCSNVNWLVEEHEFDTGADLNDTDGPYVKTNGSSKIEFKQLTRVWSDDLYNGSPFTSKYLLKISWVDDSDVPREAFYTVADTQKPGVIITTENAASPISGTAITTLNNVAYTAINVQVIKSQISGTFVTPIGDTLTVLYNTSDTLYFTTSTVLSKVPVQKYSHLKFAETAFSTTAGSWMAASGMLRARTTTATNFSALSTVLRVYTTPYVSQIMSYSFPREVFTLEPGNISIKIV